MKKWILTAIAALVAVAFVSCEEKKSSEEQAEEAVEAINEAVAEVQEAVYVASEEVKAKFAELGEGFFGTYVAAELPGNPGTKSTLTINADGSYHMSDVDVNGEPAGEENGGITAINVENGVVLTLTANDGAVVHLFKLVDGKLLLLSPEGEEPAEEMRNFYFYVRQ